MMNKNPEDGLKQEAQGALYSTLHLSFHLRHKREPVLQSRTTRACEHLGRPHTQIERRERYEQLKHQAQQGRTVSPNGSRSMPMKGTGMSTPRRSSVSLHNRANHSNTLSCCVAS
jgi:hypothetical protein